MTRINCGIKPAELNKKHLLAELREIKRIPNVVFKKSYVDCSKIPTKFKLGSGHVTFFYDKIKYLHERYDALYSHAISLNCNVSDFSESFKSIQKHKPELYNSYNETSEDRKILIERLIERDSTYIKIFKNEK